MEPGGQSSSSSEPLKAYLILTTETLDTTTINAPSASMIILDQAQQPQRTFRQRSMTATSQGNSPGSSPPLPLPSVSRPRLQTWTFSPADSGYSDYVASPTQPDSPHPLFGGTLKRRANSTEEIFPSDHCNKILRQYELTEHSEEGAGADLEPGPSKKANIIPTRRPKAWPQFPPNVGNTELVIVLQPEAQHRPRYETEGSRGRIKDRSGSSTPLVQLKNFSGSSAFMHVFIGEEKDPIVPHPLYRVCKINSKNSSPALIRTLEDHTTVLEMPFSEKDKWTLAVDCVSIMKIRNADYEEKVEGGGETVKKSRKRLGSPKVRLIFRAFITSKKGKTDVLQVASMPIACCATPGIPEITFISHKSCPAYGSTEIVIIGKNFIKNDTTVIVVEKNKDDDILWEAVVELKKDKMAPVHLVATMPAYRNLVTSVPVDVYLIVRNTDGKQSDPYKFQYTPNPKVLEALQAMETECTPVSTPVPLIRANSPISSPATPLPSSPLFQSDVQAAPAQESCVHYHFKLPGTNQDMYISIPQSQAIPGQHPVVTPVVPAPQMDIDFNNQILQEPYQPPSDEFVVNVMDFLQQDQPPVASDLEYTEDTFAPRQRTRQFTTDSSTSDDVKKFDQDDAFEQLLRDILGTSSDSQPPLPFDEQSLDVLLPNVSAGTDAPWSEEAPSDNNPDLNMGDQCR